MEGKRSQFIDIFWTTVASIAAGGLMLWISSRYDSTHILSYIWKINVTDISLISDKIFQILLAQYQLTFLIVSIITILGNKDEVLLWEDLIQKILVTPRFRNLIDLTIYSFVLLAFETIAFITSQYLLVMICFGLTAVILIYMILKVLKIYFGRNVFMEKMYKQYSLNTMMDNSIKTIVKSKIFKKDLTEELSKCIESGNKNLETLYDKTVLAINNSNNLIIRENMSFFLNAYKQVMDFDEVLKEYKSKLFRKRIIDYLLKMFDQDEIFDENEKLQKRLSSYKLTIQYYLQWLYKDIASNNIIFFTQLIIEAAEEYDFIVTEEYLNILIETLENNNITSSVKGRIIETCIKLERKKDFAKEYLIMDYIADTLNRHIKNDEKADVLVILNIIDQTIFRFKREKQEGHTVTVFSSLVVDKLKKTVGELNPKYDFNYAKYINKEEDYYTFNLEDDEEDLRLTKEEYILKYSEGDLSIFDRYMNWLKWILNRESQYYKDLNHYMASIEITNGKINLPEPEYLIAEFNDYKAALLLKLETPEKRRNIDKIVEDLTDSIIKQIKGN